jgi:hypothetical protein
MAKYRGLMWKLYALRYGLQLLSLTLWTVISDNTVLGPNT